MEQHKFQFSIEAETHEKAKEVAQALSNIYKNASNDDIIKLANAVTKNPSLIKKALNYLKFL